MTIPTIIEIRVIKHQNQRYNTIGDWQIRGRVLEISVSRLTTPVYQWLIMVHELVEAIGCLVSGVSQYEVSEFDRKWELEHSIDDDSEPGDDVTAPYYNQHQIATLVERLVAFSLGVNWNVYEDEINKVWLANRKGV